MSESNGGGNFLAVLAIVFIVLKLTGTEPFAHWSWWVVLSPIWIGLALVLLLFAIIFVLYIFSKIAKL